MTQTSYPFDGQTVSETQFSNLFKELQDTGVAGSADGTALKVTGDGGGMRVFVAPGSAIVRGFFYNSDASTQLTIPAALTSTRYDRVVLRLDPAANSVVLAVVMGAAGTGVPPAITQTATGIYEMPLAIVTVAALASNIVPSAVADDRPFVGLRMGAWTTSLRPTNPRQYQLGFNRTLGYFEHWDGAQWKQSFSTATHDHNGVYANAAHSHNGVYAPAGHTHNEFSPNTHRHADSFSNPKVVQAGRSGASVVGGNNLASGTIAFATPFDVKPVVTITVNSEGSSLADDIDAVYVNQAASGSTGIAWRIRAKTTFSTSGTVYINWIAIDPTKLG